MNLIDQWQTRKQEIEAALAAGTIDAEEAAKELKHLDYRLNRRPRILKRRHDRNAYREAQAAKLQGGANGRRRANTMSSEPPPTSTTKGTDPSKVVHMCRIEGTPTQQRDAIKRVYIEVMGGSILKMQNEWNMVGADTPEGNANASTAAQFFVQTMLDSLQPRNEIEAMLIVQLCWTHFRVGNLSWKASQQDHRENVRIVNEATDKASATFRRGMLALKEYRQQSPEPANAPKSSGKQIPSNEQSAAPQTPLETDAPGPGNSSSNGAEKSTVGTKHRAKDSRGQSAGEDECTQTRSAQRGEPSRRTGVSRPDARMQALLQPEPRQRPLLDVAEQGGQWLQLISSELHALQLLTAQQA